MLLIKKNLSWYTINGVKARQWLETVGEVPEDTRYILDDGDPLTEKVLNAPAFEPVEDDNGRLIDITTKEPPPSPPPSVKTQIETLKAKLGTTDYQAVKFAEGWISDKDYAPVKAERQALRDEISRLRELSETGRE